MLTNFPKKGNKNAWRHFLVKVGLAVVVLALVALAVADIKVYRKKRELDAQVANLQQKVQDLKSQNSALKEGTAGANDDAYIEKVAREELDLQLPDEKVVSFVQPVGQPQPGGVKENPLTGWVGSAWNSFMGIFKK